MHNGSYSHWFALLTCASLASLVSCRRASEPIPAVASPTVERKASQEIASTVGEIVATEELVLSLTKQLGNLSSSLKNLLLPDHRGRLLFAETVRVIDSSAWQTPRTRVGDIIKVMEATHPSAEAMPTQRDRLDLLRSLLNQVAFVTAADFKIVDGEFLGAGRRQFVTRVSVEGEGQRGGPVNSDVGFTGKLVLNWHLTVNGDWVIDQWTTKHLELIETRTPLFEEVMGRVVVDRTALDVARTSVQEAQIVGLMKERKVRLAKQAYYPYFTVDSSYQHPGAAVTDVEGDGDDDLYVTSRWGTNQLWVNQADGRFIEDARSHGLAIDGLTNCAIFADFDNDGDPDAFIGRSLEPSLLLENVDGHFQPFHGETGLGETLHLVSTASAADCNGDGLLDLFLGTYGARLTDTAAKHWLDDFLSPEEAKQFRVRSQTSHQYFDLVGPPNVLLINEGQGRFKRATGADQLADYRNTYQGTWSDFDLDGDPDLYVCNDFAPDTLYRNNLDAKGEPHFEDVSATLAGDAMRGFGMGASWGDYDRDGRPDLYVSNMFSKAGRRITRQIGQVDPRITYSAQGNLLFRNRADAFEQLAGLSPPSLLVAKVGWSFGGQFADFDNDGWLDLYVPSGFYSAPESVAKNVDL